MIEGPLLTIWVKYVFQKEAGTQAAFDSDPEDEKGQKVPEVISPRQIIHITQVLNTGKYAWT